jgi:hypothetical protein
MSNQLPDILSVKTLPTISNMEIKTEILDPITASDTEIIFQLPKNGILDGGSFVSLAVRTANGVADAFFPLNTGIHGLVKSAFLMSGSKVIASTEDYGHYATMIRQFETPEHRAFVEQVKVGNSCDRWCELDAGVLGTAPAGASRLIPKDLEYNNAITQATVPAFIKPTDSDATTPVFNVALSQLIPFMRSRQLPLFAMKENVFLRLILNTQSAITDGTICCFPNGSGSSGVIKPSQVNIKFYSDHLYFLDGSMEATQKQIFSENGLSYIYEDSVLTTTQIPASANPTSPAVQEQKIERDIAVSGRTIRSIMIAEKFTGFSHNLLGLYHADAESTDTGINFRINEQRYYDRDLTSPSMKYNELSKVMAKPLQVPKQIFSLDSEGNKATADNSLNQNSVYIGQIEAFQLPNADNADRTNDLRGKSHYVGVDLTTSGFNVLGNGKRIGVKPITFQSTYKRTAGRQGAKEVRFYSNVERVINIKNGEVIVSS